MLVQKINCSGIVYYEDLSGNVVSKTCSCCGVVKSLDDYTRLKAGLGGRMAECKKCRVENARIQRQERQEKEYLHIVTKLNLNGLARKRLGNLALWYENDDGEMVAKRCSKCSEIKLIDDFTIDKTKLGGRESACKDCKAVYYRENKQKYAERAILVNQRRRARQSGLPNDLKKEEYAITLEYFGNSCALTGEPDNLSIDHAIPIAVGHGGTTFNNCYPLSLSLNTSKSDFNIFEWFESNKKRFKLSQKRFESLIGWLAQVNSMTVNQYKEYVYWCFENKRDISSEIGNHLNDDKTA